MARAALRGEVRFSSGGVADDDVQLHGGACRRRALPASSCGDAVDISGNRFHVVRRKIERRHHRHARVLTAILDDRLDQLAVLIVEDELRAKQVRPAHVAAAEVGSVTRPARGGINLLAARDHRRIAGRPLLRRERGLTASSSGLAGRPLTCRGRGGALCRRLWLRRALRCDLDGERRQHEGGCRDQTRPGSHQSPRESFSSCGRS